MPVEPKLSLPKTTLGEIPGLTYRSPYTFGFKKRVALFALPPLLATCMKTLMATCRVEVRGTCHFEAAIGVTGRVIVAAWHEAFGLGISEYFGTGTHTLTSYSFDGELAARVIRRYGIFALRGSSSRGGSDALSDMVEALNHIPMLGFTPDGPRGPRRVAKPGIAILSARTRIPILPYGLAASRVWRLNSWDRFQVPKPFARILSAYAPPIPPPRDCSEEAIEETRHVLERSLADLQATLEEEASAIG